MSAFRIAPIAEEHIGGFRDYVGEVARERQYLAMHMRVDGKYYDSYLMALLFE